MRNDILLETIPVKVMPPLFRWGLKVSWFTHPLTIIVFLGLLTVIGLTSGALGYLAIAIAQLFVLILLWRYAPLSGVLWLLSFATMYPPLFAFGSEVLQLIYKSPVGV